MHTERFMAKLYFYYAAMNAGKSTLLLQSSYNYQERGLHTLLLTPSIDKRVHEGVISSRLGLKEEALAFEKEDNLYQIVIEQPVRFACILIDEAQFLTKNQVYQLTELTDKKHIPVLTYGLRTDFQGNLFEGSQYLLAWADELIELKTICHCGRKATMILRLDEKGNVQSTGEQILIGGNERYVSTCRAHFKEGNYGKKRTDIISYSV